MEIAIGCIAAIIVLFGWVVVRGAPYVPSKKHEVARAFSDLYTLSSADTLVDIGSGDGVVLRQAAVRGAHAVGYEINPLLVLISRIASRRRGVSVQWADFWRQPLPDATTVVYTFGESRDITRMARRVAHEAARLDRPLYFITYAFVLPGVDPIKTVGAHHLYLIEPLQESTP